MDFRGKKVIIVGAAKSGISSAVLLCKEGADVAIYDSKKKENLNADLFKEVDTYKYTDLMGKDIFDYIDDADMLVMSPGVPTNLPFVQKAVKSGISVISEIELGFITSEADFVAITGTNGKTTTTDLTGEIFKNAGKHTFVLGNIGVPITKESRNTVKGDFIIAETAALQLDTIRTYRPKACAVLNITEDHLNRYITMDNYINAKARIFENQQADDFCILNYDNDITRKLADRVPSRVVYFSRLAPLEEGAYVENGDVVFSFDGRKTVIMPVSEIYIPGYHNLENALAASALAMVCGISPAVIACTLKKYRGVEHRIEFVRTVNGVDFINDSKGTNPDATIKAVDAMTKPTVLILGGSEKDNDFTEMFRHFGPGIKHCIFIGETVPSLISGAENAGFKKYIVADTFKEAVEKAYCMAGSGGTVLLSPACASFDMFRDFEHRGDVFKEIVREL